MIFLDNATTTKPSETVLHAMWPFFETRFHSTHAPYDLGQELLLPLQKARKQVALLVKAREEDHFVFTSSGAEAVTQVVHTVYKEVSQRTGKIHFITSEIEEAPIMQALSALEDESCHISHVKLNKYGQVTLDSLAEEVTPRTALVSLSLASGLTGVIQPVSEIAELCRERGILLHLDATHACGKLSLDFEALGAAFITFNGEQIQAPRGSGALFSRKLKPVPLIHGAPLNVAHLIGLGQASYEAENSLTLYGTEVARIRSLFEETILLTCPGAKVLLDNAERLPHISLISFEGIFNELLLFQLARKKVYANIGGGNVQSLEAVLRHCHIDPVTAAGAVSFALSKETTERDVLQAATIISETATRLRRLSKAIV